MAALGGDEGVEPHLSADPFELRDGGRVPAVQRRLVGHVSDGEIERLRAGAATPTSGSTR